MIVWYIRSRFRIYAFPLVAGIVVSFVHIIPENARQIDLTLSLGEMLAVNHV